MLAVAFVVVSGLSVAGVLWIRVRCSFTGRTSDISFEVGSKQMVTKIPIYVRLRRSGRGPTAKNRSVEKH